MIKKNAKSGDFAQQVSCILTKCTKVITGNKMFHIFFAVNYWITKYIFRNSDYPLFSTIFVVTAYEFSTLLFLYQLVFYQIYHRRDLVTDESKIIGFSVITIILLLNFYYFKNSKRTMKILKNFNELKKESRFIYKLISILFMLLVIVLTIYMLYSIRNNIHWW